MTATRARGVASLLGMSRLLPRPSHRAPQAPETFPHPTNCLNYCPNSEVDPTLLLRHSWGVNLGWPYRRFWAASGLANVADGMFGIALSLAALSITRQPLAISALRAASGLPALLLGLFAGVLADRTDRLRLMATVQVLRTGVLIGVTAAFLLDRTPLWLLYLAATGMGVAQTIFDTSAETMVPKLVAADHLERANSRLAGVELVGNFFVGPPLGGLIAGLSMAASFATGSVMYLLAGITLLTVHGTFRAERPTASTTIRSDLLEGLRYLRAQPLLRRLALVTGARLISFFMLAGVLPVYAVAPGPMGLSTSEYGFFVAATAIGAVLASLTGERLLARVGAARCLRWFGLAFAVTALAPLLVNPFAVGALWTVGTYFVIIWNVVTLSVRQRLVPEHLLGRVNSAYRVLTWGAAPVGGLLGGVLAQMTSPAVTFVVCAAASASLTGATWPLTDDGLAAGVVSLPAATGSIGPTGPTAQQG